MTFLERVRAWLAKRPKEPTAAEHDHAQAEAYRRAGEAFADECARRVAGGQFAYFPGDGEGPRTVSQDGDGWMRWDP